MGSDRSRHEADRREQAAAAKLLDMSRTTLYVKLAYYGVEEEEWEEEEWTEEDEGVT